MKLKLELFDPHSSLVQVWFGLEALCPEPRTEPAVQSNPDPETRTKYGIQFNWFAFGSAERLPKKESVWENSPIS